MHIKTIATYALISVGSVITSSVGFVYVLTSTANTYPIEVNGDAASDRIELLESALADAQTELSKAAETSAETQQKYKEYVERTSSFVKKTNIAMSALEQERNRYNACATSLSEHSRAIDQLKRSIMDISREKESTNEQ